MPTYTYECPKCLEPSEVVKPLSELDAPEYCPDCNGEMTRVISHVQINTSNCQFQSHFNHAFGKVVRSKKDIQNEIRRINGETGKDIVEVGTDNLKSIKKQRKEYTLD